jgi:hypothetical protein
VEYRRRFQNLTCGARGHQRAFGRAARGLAVAALLSSGLGASSARADAASEARVHYDRAIKFYDDGSYDAALVELTRAYDLHPSYRLMYNIGQARLAMRDYAGAIEAYQRYLREGGGQVTNERVATVRNQLNDLQQRVGKLTVETDVSDAEILVDDVAMGTAPLPAALVVNAGMRRVTVRHPDYPTHSQRIGIAAGEQHHVSLPLRPRQPDATPAAPVAPNASPPAETSEPPLQPSEIDHPTLSAAELQSTGSEGPDRTLAWVGTGVTVALAATAITLGVVTLNKNSDLKDRRSQPGEDVGAFDDDRKSMDRLAIATDALGLAAIAAGGVTTWLWLRDGGSRRERAARAKSGIRVGFAGAGARLAGEF